MNECYLQYTRFNKDTQVVRKGIVDKVNNKRSSF